MKKEMKFENTRLVGIKLPIKHFDLFCFRFGVDIKSFCYLPYNYHVHNAIKDFNHYGICSEVNRIKKYTRKLLLYLLRTYYSHDSRLKGTSENQFHELINDFSRKLEIPILGYNISYLEDLVEEMLDCPVAFKLKRA